MGLMDFFSHDAGQARRKWLDDKANGLVEFVPPELRPWLALGSELNPVTSFERAGQGAQRVADPNVQGWDKVAAVGDTASNMAGFVAPMVAASKGAVPAANAVEDALLGWSQSAGVPQFVTDESGALRVYHGSPHDFDRFSMDKIGTGEGAQAYGHGLYFAENEGIAQSYKGVQGMASVDPMPNVASKQLAAYGDTPKMREFMRLVFPNAGDEKIEAAIATAKNPPTGRMYEVQINANPEDFLDWDKPLSEQPKVLQRLGMSARPEQEIHDEALRLMTEGNAREHGKMWFDFPDLSARIDELQNELDRRAPNVTGQEYYRGGSSDDVAGILSQMGYGNPEVQSQALREAGIPGIRYLDAGSRGAGDGSRNYVVFDENLISILRKYGLIPGAIGAGAYGMQPNQAQAGE